MTILITDDHQFMTTSLPIFAAGWAPLIQWLIVSWSRKILQRVVGGCKTRNKQMLNLPTVIGPERLVTLHKSILSFH